MSETTETKEMIDEITENIPEIPFADDEETQREISGILWGIFILTFCTQVLTALMFLLTNPSATWQATLVMVIMAAQGTLFGGAIKMLTKKLEWIQNKLDKETTDNMKIGLEKNNLDDKIGMLEKELGRVNVNLDNAHAEILALKKNLYLEPPSEVEVLKKELADLQK